MAQGSLIQKIAAAIQARENCRKSDNAEWFQTWTDRLDYIARNVLPSGSGIDGGTAIYLDESNSQKIVLHTSFHHMDENGSYDGWTEHTIVVRPAFDGIDITIKGRDRNEIKDYLGEVFHHCLTQAYDWPADEPAAV